MRTQLATRLQDIRDRIAAAAARSGRPATAIRCIAIGKTHPVAALHAAYGAGQRAFGENYIHELVEKAARLPSDIEWHCVGHVQRNKINALVPRVAWIQSLDSERLAAALQQRATHPIQCLIEVNLANEPTKRGVQPGAVISLLRGIGSLTRVRVRGLMCIPPLTADSRPYFRRLAHLLTELNAADCYPTPLTELSMGMSDDFEIAIEEGATMIRIGRALFGERFPR